MADVSGASAAGYSADSEGSTIMTKYGAVKTDHILFIAAGAFPSTNLQFDPELQDLSHSGRTADSHQEDLKRILLSPIILCSSNTQPFYYRRGKIDFSGSH